MPLFLPAESDIDGMDVTETIALAEALLLQPQGDSTGNSLDGVPLPGGPDLGALKRLIVTARRCIDPDKEDQAQVKLAEALELYTRLGLDPEAVPMDAEEPLFYIAPIAQFYADNLPD